MMESAHETSVICSVKKRRGLENLLRDGVRRVQPGVQGMERNELDGF